MAKTASVFDSTQKGAAVTLSGSNLIATVSSGTGSVLGTNKVDGLIYGEWIIGATMTGSCRVGVANVNFTTTGLLGVDSNGLGYDSGGTVKINNVTVATIAAFAATNRIGWAVDPVNRLIWFRVNNGNWNNDVIGNQNPVGSVGGISYATVGNCAPAWGGSATASVTAKYATASWTDTAPTGYASIDSQNFLSAANGQVADRAASFTNYRSANTQTPSTPGQYSAGTAQRASVMPGFYENSKFWSPAATATTISGATQEAGGAVPGKKIFLLDPTTGLLLGTTTSDGSGNFGPMPCLGRTQVLAVGLDPSTYQPIGFDRITPG